MKWGRWVGSLYLAMVVVVASPAASEECALSGTSTPVEVMLISPKKIRQKFTVPSDYMEGTPLWKQNGGKYVPNERYSLLSIAVVYPSFCPLRDRDPRDVDAVKIDAVLNDRKPDAGEFFKHQYTKPTQTGLAAPYVSTGEMLNGLEVYRWNPARPRSPDSPVPHILFLAPAAEGEAGLYIDCKGEEAHSFCSMTTMLVDTISAAIWFPYAKLAEWKDIRSRSAHLVRSFSEAATKN